MSTLRATNIKNPDSGSNNIVLDGSGGVVISGVTTVSAGSASVPSISVSGDSNTGVFFPSADTVALSSGGSERIRIDSSGRLLINTTTSSAAFLTVNGTVEDNGSLYRAVFGNGYIDGDSTGATGGNGAEVQIQAASTSRAPVLSLGGAMASGEGLGRITFFNSGNTDGKRLRAIIGGQQVSGTANEQGAILYFSTAGDAATTPTERFRITQLGNFKFSTNGSYRAATSNLNEIRQNNDNTALYIDQLYNFGASGGEWGIVIDFDSHTPDNNSSNFLTCRDATADRMRVYSDGDVWTSDAGTLTSDVTLKRDITDATPKLDDLMNLRVRNFYWEESYHPNKQDKKLIGFIAQEFEEVFPGLVSEHKIKGGEPILDEDGNETGETTPEVFKKGIKEGKLIPILVKALQEAVDRIETLEASNNDLAARVAALEGN